MKKMYKLTALLLALCIFTVQLLEFDEAVQKLFIRHDGGEDTPKGVLKASLYPDYAEIQDKEAANLLVSLDIYRGIPVDGKFIFGGSRKLAKSVFIRMLMAAYGGYKKDIFAVERIESGTQYTLGEIKAAVDCASVRQGQYQAGHEGRRCV